MNSTFEIKGVLHETPYYGCIMAYKDRFKSKKTTASLRVTFSSKKEQSWLLKWHFFVKKCGFKITRTIM